MARTTDFADVIRAELAADPKLAEAVEDELFNATLAEMVLRAREDAEFTQEQLANEVGTTQSVISRIEDANYSGRSLRLLRRIAKALGKRIRIEFYDDAHVATVTATQPIPVDAAIYQFEKYLKSEATV